MSNLSRIPAVTAALTLAFAGHAGAAELKQAPAAVQKESMTIQSQPELEGAVQEDDGGTAGTAPKKLAPQVQPQLKESGTSAPGSAPKPTLKTRSRLKSTPKLQQAPKAIGTSPTQGSGIGSGPELEPRLGSACPDPKLERIRILHPGPLNDDGSFSVVRFFAYVRNVGGAEFRTGRGQAIVKMQHGSREMAYSLGNQFVRLPPGEQTSIIGYISDYSIGDEFNADVVAEIIYDPDFRKDGNPNNDDCNMRNHRMVLRARDIRSTLEEVRASR